MTNEVKSPQVKDSEIKHEIAIPADFSYTRENPYVIHGWKVWKNFQGLLIAVPVEEEPGQRSRAHKFDFEEGTLYLVSKGDLRYAYFRSNRFQAFLDKYRITRVMKQSPNGEYQGRYGESEFRKDSCFLVSDGTSLVKTFTSLSTNTDEKPIVSLRFPNHFITVEGATFVLFEQITDKPAKNPKELGKRFVSRYLVTDQVVFEIEDKVAEAVAKLADGGNEEVVEEEE